MLLFRPRYGLIGCDCGNVHKISAEPRRKQRVRLLTLEQNVKGPDRAV